MLTVAKIVCGEKRTISKLATTKTNTSEIVRLKNLKKPFNTREKSLKKMLFECSKNSLIKILPKCFKTLHDRLIFDFLRQMRIGKKEKTVQQNRNDRSDRCYLIVVKHRALGDFRFE